MVVTERVTLQEITAATVREVCKLAVAPEQQGLVAPNAVSIAEAYFEPAAWFRAICADDKPVGFAMLYDPTRTDAPEQGPEICYLWRLMVDSRWQKRGYGSVALDLLIDHARTLPGVTRLRTSYVPSANNASGLYERMGFRATGAMDEGEVVMELTLDRSGVKEQR